MYKSEMFQEIYRKRSDRFVSFFKYLLVILVTSYITHKQSTLSMSEVESRIKKGESICFENDCYVFYKVIDGSQNKKVKKRGK